MLNTETNTSPWPYVMLIGAIIFLIALFGGFDNTQSPSPQIGGGVNETVVFDEGGNLEIITKK
jgi:hypothetical protein